MSETPQVALVRTHPAGTVLFQEGEPASRMYVIRKGRVRIFRKVADTQIVLAFLGPGEFFGEMALLEGLPRSAGAETVEESDLIEVEESTFQHLLRTNSEVAVRMLRRLASRVRESDHRIQHLLFDSAVSRALEVLKWLRSVANDRDQSGWVRVRGGNDSIDLAAQAGIPPGQANDVYLQLESAGCWRAEADDILIADDGTLEEYGVYLDLKRRYEMTTGALPNEAAGQRKEDQTLAMRRLLEALRLTPADFEARQAALAHQYRRYVALKQRFRRFEDPEE